MNIASRRSTRIARCLGTNPVAVLATLFLLSYAKLLRSIINPLFFTFLKYPYDTKEVWLVDGNIPYLKGKPLAEIIGLGFARPALHEFCDNCPLPLTHTQTHFSFLHLFVLKTSEEACSSKRSVSPSAATLSTFICATRKQSP